MIDFIELEEAEQKSSERTPRRELIFVNAKSWQDAPVPARRWLVANRIPMKNVTLLQGDGGTGKTTIALQLAISVDQKMNWLGLAVDEQGPAIFFSAEEDEEEIHRRVAAITAHRNVALDSLKAVHLLGMSGEDVTLGAPTRNSDVIRPTQLFFRLEEAVCDIRPKLVVIEAAADVFGGNENNRSQVRQFVGLLRRLARTEVGAAVMLLQHPSLTGISTGTGNSGSTQWSNSGRSRLYFSKVKANGSEEPDLRQLEVMKSNYGPSGGIVKVRWEQGLFVPEVGLSTVQRAAAELRADDIFLRCLETKRAQGIEVVATTGRGYAPSAFATMPDAKGLSVRLKMISFDLKLLRAVA